jgi:O-antigen ligase
LLKHRARRAAVSAAFSFLPLVAAVLVFAPIFRGGNRPLPLLVLELLAVCLFVLFLVEERSPWTALGKLERAALAILVVVPLVSLLPLPASLWGVLPARSPYLESLALFGADTASAWRSLAIVPHSAETSALALLPPLAVFMGVLACSDSERERLVRVFLAVAALEAALGLAQYGSQGGFYLGMEVSGSAQGTYPNRNHFAGLFEMAAPLAAALFAANFGHSDRPRRYRRRGIRAVFATLGEAKVNTYIGFLVLLVFFGLAVVFSRSRTGIALFILGIILLTAIFAPRLGGRRTLRSVGGVAVLLSGLAVAVGLVPVLQRFAAEDAVANDRWPMASATIDGIGAFFPFGAGAGNFPDVFRRFHPEGIAGFINHAHNDYLEWLFEGGLLAGLALALILAAYGRQWFRVLRAPEWHKDNYLRIGAALGILLIGLHGLVDFNLRIPANAIFIALLFGLLFAPVTRDTVPDEKHARKPAERKIVEPSPAAPPPLQPPPDTSNPFAS